MHAEYSPEPVLINCFDALADRWVPPSSNSTHRVLLSGLAVFVSDSLFETFLEIAIVEFIRHRIASLGFWGIRVWF